MCECYIVGEYVNVCLLLNRLVCFYARVFVCVIFCVNTYTFMLER